MSGAAELPDRDGRAGAGVAGTGVLLVAARDGADGLNVGASEDPYTTTFSEARRPPRNGGPLLILMGRLAR